MYVKESWCTRKGRRYYTYQRINEIALPVKSPGFDIEDCKMPMINQLISEHKELLELFDMEERFFSDFTVARRAVV